MSNAAAAPRAVDSATPPPQSPPPRRRQVPAFLVTSDAELWPQIGAHLPSKLSFRQLDSIDELSGAAPSGQPAIVLWDARDSSHKQEALSRIQSHSACFAVIVLDDGDAPMWESAVEHAQIAALVPIPVEPSRLSGAIGGAYEEVQARSALLGQPGAASAGRPPPARQVPWRMILAAAALLVAAGAFLTWHLESGARRERASRPAAGAPAAPPAGSEASPADSAASVEDKVDSLIEEAQTAMRNRHFIEPAAGSALALYRSALLLDPASGEARQGLQRLAEILVAKVQSALDERQFDAALQALETVRSIDPGDKRLPGLDERIAKMRAEFGPAEIQAAINAENFDRAVQLIEQADKTKSVPEPKLNQLREDVRRHRAQSDISRVVALADARLQQNNLIDPPDDSAAFYLAQARKAGAAPAELQRPLRELSRRLTAGVHDALAQHRLEEADRLAAGLASAGAPPAATAAVQHDISTARSQQTAAVPEHPRYLDLARSRLAQGKVVDPDNDSALYYTRQLEATDPQNPGLAPLQSAVQAQIVDQARAALDGAQPQPGRAGMLLQLAAALGSSPDVDALRERLQGPTPAPSTGPREVAEASLTRTRVLDIEYPQNALADRVEGSVEVGYVISPKGTVSDVRVLTSTPPRVFDRAASNAVTRLRYKPYVENGSAIAVSTKMLVIFRLSK